MDLTPYLDAVSTDVERATALADDSVRDVAQRLVASLEPGLRLALVRALSDAAAQVSSQLEEAVVTVTLVGQDPVLTVTRTPTSAPSPGAAPPDAPDSEGDGDTARITLRLPEQLKARAEDLAAAAGQSLNTWLVQTVRRATSDTLSAIPTPGSRRVTGWA